MAPRFVRVTNVSSYSLSNILFNNKEVGKRQLKVRLLIGLCPTTYKFLHNSRHTATIVNVRRNVQTDVRQLQYHGFRIIWKPLVIGNSRVTSMGHGQAFSHVVRILLQETSRAI